MHEDTKQDDRIDGVGIRALTPHRDTRGRLVEIYREHWDLGCRPVQFNAVTSEAGVLRGVHVHVSHADHLFLATGSMRLGLHDLRPWSPTTGQSWQVELSGPVPQVVIIPPGVAHGFCFPVPSLLFYGTSDYFDPQDELACRFDASELQLSWPVPQPTISDRDRDALGYEAFRSAFLARWRHVHGAIPDR